MIRFSTLMMFLFILCMVGFTLYFYPKLPQRMAAHWNAQGQVDGFLPKAVNLSILPVTAVLLTFLFLGLVQIDPMRRNIQQFRSYYDGFIFIVLALLAAIQAYIIAWNLGIKIRMNILMPLLLSLLFFGMGCILDKVKSNWFIGIRTPWTFSSPTVWKKTHLWGAILFKLAAAVVLLGVIWEQYAIVFVLVPILVASLITIILSYVFYKQQSSLH